MIRYRRSELRDRRPGGRRRAGRRRDVREAPVAAVALDDEQRGGLLAAPVASRRLGGGEAAEQPLGERCAADAVKAAASSVDGLLRDEDVPLSGEARARRFRPPSPCSRRRCRWRSRRAVDDAELAFRRGRRRQPSGARRPSSASRPVARAGASPSGP